MKSCDNCIHHVVCQTPNSMMRYMPGLAYVFNEFSNKLHQFLGSNCPHYRAEEQVDEPSHPYLGMTKECKEQVKKANSKITSP